MPSEDLRGLAVARLLGVQPGKGRAPLRGVCGAKQRKSNAALGKAKDTQGVANRRKGWASLREQGKEKQRPGVAMRGKGGAPLGEAWQSKGYAGCCKSTQRMGIAQRARQRQCGAQYRKGWRGTAKQRHGDAALGTVTPSTATAWCSMVQQSNGTDEQRPSTRGNGMVWYSKAMAR